MAELIFATLPFELAGPVNLHPYPVSAKKGIQMAYIIQLSLSTGRDCIFSTAQHLPKAKLSLLPCSSESSASPHPFNSPQSYPRRSRPSTSALPGSRLLRRQGLSLPSEDVVWQ
ncbi:unnamed protein product [Protopolystoma xenopodis]|uniref:Uncharacterized protein n=1 Tax=Protopolystoma xenopodis TaxID=117903 RepID=A0A3S4ZUB3_9PLAT|nr:unnamed protein product [Protopolystoma xenopodis]